MEEFEQLKKNTVAAKNQLCDGAQVFLFPAGEPGLHVLFVGNSITLHGIKDDIGWHRCCGMAASCEEKDYVHILIDKVHKSHPSASFCICQASEWERQYKNGQGVLELYSDARNFNSDIIVLRIVENCPAQDFDGELFKANLKEFLAYLDPSGQAKVILTTGFFRHPGDSFIETMAWESGLPLVTLGDLGERDEMKALGLFEHSGVANHPGDLGMSAIAERIYAAMSAFL